MKDIDYYLAKHLKEVRDRVKGTNRKLILSFYRSLVAENLTKSPILNYVRAVIRFHFLRNGKPFTDYSKEDVEDIIFQLKQIKRYKLIRGKRQVWIEKPYSDAYIHFFVVSLKKFLKWLNGGIYPAFVQNIRYARKHRLAVRDEDVLSPQDIKKMVEASIHPRDRAFIWCLFELGCRIGEMRMIRRRDIEFDDYGAIIVVNSEKQGSQELPQRRLRVVFGAPYLATWLNMLPNKDPDSFVWVGLGTRAYRGIMTYNGYQRILVRAAADAGIRRRRIWNHLFRHSRETDLEKKGVPVSLQKKHMGWKQNSLMPGYYSHMNLQDVDDFILSISGIKKDKTKDQSLGQISCPRCNKANPPTDSCLVCGFALNDQAYAKRMEEQQLAMSLLRGLKSLGKKDKRLLTLINEALDKEAKE